MRGSDKKYRQRALVELVFALPFAAVIPCDIGSEGLSDSNKAPIGMRGF
jgi:hypothetical protein